MIATVLDTGPLAAALNAADRRHSECASLLTSLTGRWLLPSPVMTEVCWLLERWPQVEAAFLAEVARGTWLALETAHLVALAVHQPKRMPTLSKLLGDEPKTGGGDARRSIMKALAVATGGGVSKRGPG